MYLSTSDPPNFLVLLTVSVLKQTSTLPDKPSAATASSTEQPSTSVITELLWCRANSTVLFH
ncbi:hypothetical protein BDA96_10G159600 [Sorghum bicolor]|uniref:Uncharacterized protein n=1 Tax=Sorghum bicolor TaxID=4558 RepID=A0A921Q5D9_SORBI|nr:hypothetical protein BDA96_10G159600 [Sorghum bicolor]